MDADFTGALPRERVVDDNGDAGAGGVDSFVDGLERAGFEFVGGVADYVVVFLRVLMDDADAGTCGAIVALIAENFLTILRAFVSGIFVAIAPSQASPLPSIEHLLF